MEEEEEFYRHDKHITNHQTNLFLEQLFKPLTDQNALRVNDQELKKNNENIENLRCQPVIRIQNVQGISKNEQVIQNQMENKVNLMNGYLNMVATLEKTEQLNYTRSYQQDKLNCLKVEEYMHDNQDKFFKNEKSIEICFTQQKVSCLQDYLKREVRESLSQTNIETTFVSKFDEIQEKKLETEECIQEEIHYDSQYIINKLLSQNDVYLINGDIILSFDIFDRRKDREHNKVAQWNLFRPIHSIISLKKMIEITMHKSKGSLNQFQHLIQRLMNMNDQKAHESAKILQHHQSSINDEQIIKQKVLSTFKGNISKLQSKLDENFQFSLRMAYQLIDELPEDSFYMYSIRRTDPISFDNIFWALGYSKPLVHLVAGNEPNFSNFCFRSGLLEIFNNQSRLQILFMNLLYCNSVEVSITTLDDYIIPVEVRVYYQKLIPTEILPGVYKEDYMKIYQILVDQKYIKELSRIRSQQAMEVSCIQESMIFNSFQQISSKNRSYKSSVDNFLQKFYLDHLRKETTSCKLNNKNEKDQENLSAEFERIFGKQDEGQNCLKSVFNTKLLNKNQGFLINQSSNLSISQFSDISTITPCYQLNSQSLQEKRLNHSTKFEIETSRLISSPLNLLQTTKQNVSASETISVIQQTNYQNQYKTLS